MTTTPTGATPTLLPGVSIVVPVYNGAGSVTLLTERLTAVLGSSLQWEVIFVVDGSPDDSWQVVQGLAGAYPNVCGIDLFRNFGQHNALLAGIRQARYDVIVTMDDDLQHRPESVPTLLDALAPDFDLVYGKTDIEEHGLWRSLASRLAKAAMGASMGGPMARDSGAFRAFRTALRDGFIGVDDPYVSIDVVLSWVTTRYTTCLTPMDQRAIGTSAYTMRKLLRHALNMMTGYSTKPLRLVTWLGFCMATFGLGVLAYVVVRRFTTSAEVPGFAFLASLVSILAGAQLFGLGVIGEYLGRMHFRSMQRPPYVIRQIATAQPIEAEAQTKEANGSNVNAGF